jgi:methionyl-tRNA synthetase
MFIITTPIPYTNATPHLGHLLEGIYTDSLARYWKYIKNEEVLLTMGLDQHGLKIYQSALALKQDPNFFVEEQGEKFLKIWKQFNVNYSEFVPTHTKRHQLLSQSIFRTLQKSGNIYKKQYKGLYCVGCEDFYTISQLEENNCCPIHKKPVIEMEETNYFFKLSEYTDEIKKYLNTSNIKPEGIKNEWLSFIDQGLMDISCTREKERLPWGIEVPNDDTQVMYVWIEALLNYCTALFSTEELLQFNDEQILQKIRNEFPIDVMYFGKDISKFHLVIFPAILSALNIELPKLAISHGMINDTNGIKMSKSLGNGIDPQEVYNLFGVDGTRFVFLNEINIFGDSNFDWERIKLNYNAFLANNLGNLFTRVTTLAQKYGFNGVQKINFDWTNYHNYFENGDTKLAFQEIYKASVVTNEYLESTKPWMMVKIEGNENEVKDVLGGCIEHLKEVAKYMYPFLPDTSLLLQEQLNKNEIEKITPIFERLL